jgi:hypothetical protein
VRRTRIGFLVIAQTLAMGSAAALGAECQVNRNAVQLGMRMNVQMLATSGQDCRVRLPPEGGNLLDVNRITTHPHHGGVRVEGFSGAAYRSNPGYKGLDRFAFEFCGWQDGRSICTAVNVKVDVR